jgi:hypothetical protein
MILCDPEALLRHTIIGINVVGDELIEIFTEDGNPDEPRYIVQPVEGIIDSIEGDLADLCECKPLHSEVFFTEGLPVFRMYSFYGEVDIIFSALDVAIFQC